MYNFFHFGALGVLVFSVNMLMPSKRQVDLIIYFPCVFSNYVIELTS